MNRPCLDAGVLMSLLVIFSVVESLSTSCASFISVPSSSYSDIVYFYQSSGYPNWFGARTWCQQNLHPNSSLLVIRDQAVAQTMGNLNAISWTGLAKDQNVSDPLAGWNWYPDNVTLDDRPVLWASKQAYGNDNPANPAQPDNYNDWEHCAFIQANGYFSDCNCTFQMTPLCEVNGTYRFISQFSSDL
jgi:hypothetical protein